jgi:hypothetical protein
MPLLYGIFQNLSRKKINFGKIKPLFAFAVRISAQRSAIFHVFDLLTVDLLTFENFSIVSRSETTSYALALVTASQLFWTFASAGLDPTLF